MKGRLQLAKNNKDIKMELIRTITSFHSFAGTIMLGAITLSGDSLSRLKQNTLVSVFLGVGIVLYLVTFLLIKSSYNLKQNNMDLEKINWSFWCSMSSIVIFLIILITLNLG